jgi:hypothetical protein
VWYRALGAGAFDAGQRIDPVCPPSGALRFALADVDSDGDPDLVQARDSDLAWFENVGGVFGAAGDIARIDPLVSLVAVDADADGDEDLAVGIAGASPGIELLVNLGGTFDAPVMVVAPSDAIVAPLAAADMNGDGAVDLVTPTAWFAF